MKVRSYLDNIRAKFDSWMDKKSVIMTTKRIVIRLSQQSISFIFLDYLFGEIELLATETHHYENSKELSALLRKWVTQYQLQGTPTHWLLDPVDYQLIIIESLPVSLEETRSAIQWYIQGMIQFPIEEAIFDYFPLPQKKNVSNEKMMAVIITKAALLTERVALFKSSGLLPFQINVPELALQRLTGLLEQDEKTSAFIYIYKQQLLLTLTNTQLLYYTRQIALPETPDIAQLPYEKLALEILRNFDYVQNQWRLPAPSRIYVGADHAEVNQIAQLLATQMQMPVTLYPSKLLPMAEAKLAFPLEQLLSLGCVLHKEMEYATTGD